MLRHWQLIKSPRDCCRINLNLRRLFGLFRRCGVSSQMQGRIAYLPWPRCICTVGQGLVVNGDLALRTTSTAGRECNMASWPWGLGRCRWENNDVWGFIVLEPCALALTGLRPHGRRKYGTNNAMLKMDKWHFGPDGMGVGTRVAGV